MRNFYETEIEISAGFGPVGNIEKKIGADYEQLLRAGFHVEKELDFSLNIVASALKICIK